MVSFGNLTPADTPVIWRGPLISKAFEQFCYDVAWGELDYLVLDLPPGTGDIQLTLVEKLPIAGAVIVSTPQDIALIDVTKGISMFRQLDVPILGLVENMALHTCTNCGHQEHIFGDQLNRFAADQNISVLAKIPLTAELRLRSDRGQPMGRSHFAFATLVDTIVARLTP
jgi:ATP-binding protein involved in chromosome partitioning